MKIRCRDCYEENDWEAQRCRRCGRLLDEAKRDKKESVYQHQHADAPSVMRKKTTPRKVW